MPVLVTGATGVVGRALVPKLVDSGGQVRVYVRRDVPEYRAIGVKVAVGEADHEGRLESALEQVHTIVHLIGGPEPEAGTTLEWLNLDTTTVAIRAAENAEVRRILFLSPIGAAAGSAHPYLDAKGRAEDAVRASKLEHAVFRCAPIVAPGSILERAFERGLSGTAPINAVAVDDVVGAIVAADTRDAEVRAVWELGGPETTTVDELAARLGVRRRSALFGRSPKALAYLAQGGVADPGDAVRQLGLTLSRV